MTVQLTRAGDCPPRRIAFLIFDGAVLLNIAGPAEAFSLANREIDAGRGGQYPQRYELELYSIGGTSVRTTSGIDVATRALPDPAHGEFDTIAIVGGLNMQAMSGNRIVLEWLRAAAPHARRIASFGSGVIILGRAGLLDRRRCAGHWRIAHILRDQFPLIDFDNESLFTRDGNCLTAVGSSASLDLALSMIEDDLGKVMALMIARVLVLPKVRPGDQPQFSAELRAQAATMPRITQAAEWVIANIDKKPTVASLADRFAMSERNFSRVFTREMGMSPQRFIETARLETARRWLCGSDLTIDSIARRSGYTNGEHFAEAFKKVMATTPGDYRRDMRAPDAIR